MPYIETLDDIVDDLADKLGIYGAHDDASEMAGCKCRVCWSSGMHDRLRAACENENVLMKGGN